MVIGESLTRLSTGASGAVKYQQANWWQKFMQRRAARRSKRTTISTLNRTYSVDEQDTTTKGSGFMNVIAGILGILGGVANQQQAPQPPPPPQKDNTALLIVLTVMVGLLLVAFMYLALKKK